MSPLFTQQNYGPANAELVRTKAEQHHSTQRSQQMYGVEKTALPLKQLQHLVSGAVEADVNTLRTDFNPSSK